MNIGIIKRIAYIERERIKREELYKRELNKAIYADIKYDQIIFINKPNK